MTRYKGTPTQGLWGATLGFFFGFAAVALFGPTAWKLQEAMALTPLMVGLLVAVPSLSGSLLRIPFAAWVDTSGGRKPFLALMVLSLCGMTGLWLLILLRYPNGLTQGLYPLLLALGVLCGCGIATFSVGIGQVAYWFPQANQGRALGIYAGLGNLAPGLFSLFLPLALGGLGLANSYLLWLGFLVAGTLLYAAFGRNAWYFQGAAQGLPCDDARREAAERGQELFPAGGLKQSLGLSARNPKTWALVGIYFTTFGGFIALTAWFPTYWHGFFGMAAVASGLLTATYAIATSVVRVGGGSLADRFGGERTAMGAFAVMLSGSAVMSVSHNAGLSIAGALLMAAGMGVGNAATFKLVPQEVPEAVGGAAGWIGGLGAFGGFVLPPLLGYAVKLWGNDGYALGFIAFDLLAVSGFLLAVILKRSHGRATRARLPNG